MNLITLRKRVESFIIEFPDDYDNRYRSEQCYYALWLMSYINRGKHIPQPTEFHINKWGEVMIFWYKKPHESIEINIAEEGKSNYLITDDEGGHPAEFKRHDVIALGNIAEHIKIMYENETD